MESTMQFLALPHSHAFSSNYYYAEEKRSKAFVSYYHILVHMHVNLKKLFSKTAYLVVRPLKIMTFLTQ